LRGKTLKQSESSPIDDSGKEATDGVFLNPLREKNKRARKGE